MDILIQAVGWVGTGFIVVAYLLVSTKKVSGDSKLYQTLNLFGAIGVGANVFHQQAWPALALQVVWAIIAIVALFPKKNLKAP